ncbi:MAG: hypothetical protein ACMG57_01455 [Candidatus Dojkabacteria bacterium]
MNNIDNNLKIDYFGNSDITYTVNNELSDTHHKIMDVNFDTNLDGQIQTFWRILLEINGVVRDKFRVPDNFPNPTFFLTDSFNINLIRSIPAEETEKAVLGTSLPSNFAVFINLEKMLKNLNSLSELLSSEEFYAIIAEELIHVYTLRYEEIDGERVINMSFLKKVGMLIDERFSNPHENTLKTMQFIGEDFAKTHLDADESMPLQSFFLEIYTLLIKSLLLKDVKPLEKNKEWAIAIFNHFLEEHEKLVHMTSKEFAELLGFSNEKIAIIKLTHIMIDLDINSINEIIKNLERNKGKKKFDHFLEPIDGLLELFQVTKKFISGEDVKLDIIRLSTYSFNLEIEISSNEYVVDLKRLIPTFIAEHIAGVSTEGIFDEES